MENLKKQLRVVLTSKRLVLLISIGSLLGTLLFVRVLKHYTFSNEEQEVPVLLDALKGKKAVSVSLKLSSLPMDFIYPGVRVDLVEVKDSIVSYVVKDVYVVGIGVMSEENLAKITLAVNNDESENIMKKDGQTLSLIVRGEGNNKDLDDIEIVEL